MMRLLIFRENAILFPLAQKNIGQEDLHALLRKGESNAQN